MYESCRREISGFSIDILALLKKLILTGYVISERELVHIVCKQNDGSAFDVMATPMRLLSSEQTELIMEIQLFLQSVALY